MEGESFNSSFNMGVSKLERIDGLLKTLYRAQIEDNHHLQLSCLKGIEQELWHYLDDKDVPKDVEKARQSCQEALLTYLKNTGAKRNPFSNYELQEKQIELENKLFEYQRLLMKGLKQHDFDMPAKESLGSHNLR